MCTVVGDGPVQQAVPCTYTPASPIPWKGLGSWATWNPGLERRCVRSDLVACRSRIIIKGSYQIAARNRNSEQNFSSRKMTSLKFESSAPSAKTMRIAYSVLDHKPPLFIRMLPIFIQSMLSRRQGGGSLGRARSIRGKGAETLS